MAAGDVDVAGEDYPTLLAEYEGLVVDREFAEESYRAALAALDGARANASRQSRYLATYVEPTYPETAEFPQRWDPVWPEHAFHVALLVDPCAGLLFCPRQPLGFGMIRFENLSKSFWIRGEQKIVIDNLNATLPTGKSLALFGRNGAGKSTLLNINCRGS